MTRRGLLLRLAAGVGVLGLGACGRPDPSRLTAALLELATDREALASIGRAFLHERPEGLDEILTRLASDLRWNDSMTTGDLSVRLGQRIDHDFRDARTYRLDAWVLSQTEVRWAALVALSGA